MEAPLGIGASDETMDPLGLTGAEYARRAAAAGVPGGLAGAVERYRALHRRGEVDQRRLGVSLPPVVRTLRSESDEGSVLKFTQSVPGAGGRGPVETESVLIPMIGRKGRRTYTLCVSSQVGCAMGCAFCQTAQMGLVRSLTPGEIVAQWFAARHVFADLVGPEGVRNIVFMGMGEPLDNVENVVGAIEVLTDHNGAAMPMNKISVSTVGRIDGIRRLAEQVRKPGWHRLNLAVSLNAPNDEVRSRIMPVNRAMPMAALKEALLEWPYYGGAKLCLEYVLIPGVNDAPAHADELGEYVRGLPALVNVIPYNPRDDSPWPAPEEAAVDAFVARLSATGAYVKRRRTKGRETMSACGQLGNPALRRRRLSPVTLGRLAVSGGEDR